MQALIEIQKYNNLGHKKRCFPRRHPDLETQYKQNWLQIIEEDNEDTMLAAPVTLRDSGVEKRQPKNATKPGVSWQQSRAIHKTFDDIPEDMDEEENQLIEPSGGDNYRVFQETLD